MTKPNKRLIHCAECGRNQRYYARGLCRLCYGRWHYAQNKEKYHVANRRYYDRTIEYQHKRRREYYALNCDRERERNRLYCLEYPERRKKAEAAYRARNREKERKRCALYRREHPGRRKATCKAWYEQNKEKAFAQARRRRARKLNATIEPVDEAAIYERDGYACIYCGATEDLTLDHVIALAKGGAHSEDNLVIACRPCNCSKGAKPLLDWLQTQPRAHAWVY